MFLHWKIFSAPSIHWKLNPMCFIRRIHYAASSMGQSTGGSISHSGSYWRSSSLSCSFGSLHVASDLDLPSSIHLYHCSWLTCHFQVLISWSFGGSIPCIFVRIILYVASGLRWSTKEGSSRRGSDWHSLSSFSVRLDLASDWQSGSSFIHPSVPLFLAHLPVFWSSILLILIKHELLAVIMKRITSYETKGWNKYNSK